MDSGKATLDAPKQEPAPLATRLDTQAAELQDMLRGLAAKVAAAERAADQKPHQQERSTVSDALKDMATTEQAMDSVESRLDSLLSRLDSLIEDNGSTG
ncbi:hypothetical protein H4R19_002668 [Coemansia spiralis]|nr:hypothetical protein H4R19_002668 [Coemansia spiralis]